MSDINVPTVTTGVPNIINTIPVSTINDTTSPTYVTPISTAVVTANIPTTFTPSSSLINIANINAMRLAAIAAATNSNANFATTATANITSNANFASNISADEEKKKPGRPRKKNVNTSIPHDGIVDSASDDRLWLDILYDNPSMFKKIFTTYKNFDVEKIFIKFDAKEIKMCAPDSIGKNYIYCIISGNKLNRYFCKVQIDIILSICSVKRILTELTKECGSIAFSMTEKMINDKLAITTNESKLDIDSYSTLEIVQNNEFKWEIIEDKIKMLDDYPINFELPAKYFKNKIGNLRSCADTLTIEKNGSGNLKFSTPFKDERGENISSFKSSNAIHLNSNIKENTIFAVSLYLEHIKSVASTTITESVRIYADKERDTIFMFLLDQDEHCNDLQQKKINESEKAKIYITTSIAKGI
jgi:hypothetical protein